MASYELWLDESGDFSDFNKKSNSKNFRSLIGGLLITKENAEKIDFSKIIDPFRIHATELTPSDKVEYVLPILKTMKSEFAAREVFFENENYISADSDKSLYIRMMAEGLLELLQHLNAIEEHVKLEVIIARKQVHTNTGNQMVPVDANEYIRELDFCVKNKKKERRMFLSENTELKYSVKIADANNKLRIADFVCNTRFTRTTSVFSDVKHELEELYDNAIIFNLHEIPSENKIKLCLANGDISGAIIELYTTTEIIDQKKMLDLICARMKNISYRLVKYQLKQCAADITSMFAAEDDYEYGEKILNKINTNLIHRINEVGDYSEFEFAILINLSNMYLREGDIVQAKTTLERCEKVCIKNGGRLEAIELFYQLQERMALYEIDSFQYDKAITRMKNVIEVLKTIINTVEENKKALNYFNDISSEYYGNALRMQIYGMIFVQKERGLYDELVKLSDIALKQYSSDGDLTRHRQYRSRIEAINGNYENAVRWLLKSKLYEVNDDTEINLDILEAFLDKVEKTEELVSCKFQLMYYVLIMADEGLNNNPLADMMYQALINQKGLFDKVGIKYNLIMGNELVTTNLSMVKKTSMGIKYHPMEIINWKLAKYYINRDKYKYSAKHYWKEAMELCDSHKEYITMRVVGILIKADYLEHLKKEENETELKEYLKSQKGVFADLLSCNIEAGTREFVEKLKQLNEDEDYKTLASYVTY